MVSNGGEFTGAEAAVSVCRCATVPPMAACMHQAALETPDHNNISIMQIPTS